MLRVVCRIRAEDRSPLTRIETGAVEFVKPVDLVAGYLGRLSDQPGRGNAGAEKQNQNKPV